MEGVVSLYKDVGDQRLGLYNIVHVEGDDGPEDEHHCEGQEDQGEASADLVLLHSHDVVLHRTVPTVKEVQGDQHRVETSPEQEDHQDQEPNHARDDRQ